MSFLHFFPRSPDFQAQKMVDSPLPTLLLYSMMETGHQKGVCIGAANDEGTASYTSKKGGVGN